MKRLLIALAAGLLLTAPLAAPALAQEDTDSNVVDVSRDDPEVNAAKAAALRNLPGFWTRFDNDPQVRQSGALKVEFVQGDSSEAMWVAKLQRGPGGAITGVLDNDPVLVTNVKAGDTIKVDPARIMDWSYTRNGKVWGHFTSRVLIKRLPAEQAASYDGLFSATPVEP